MYKLTGTTLVNQYGHVVANYSERFESTARFHLKILNGDIAPQWNGNVLIWLPVEKNTKRCVDCTSGQHTFDPTKGLIACKCPCHDSDLTA